MNATATIGERLGLDRTGVLWGMLLVDVEILILAAYVLFERVQITDPFILVFPFLWINVALWAIVTTRVPEVGTRAKYLGLAIGLGYFLLLAYVGGLVRPGHALVHGGHAHAFGVRWSWPLPPGWGPTMTYAGAWVGFTLTPYKLVGYAALAYLVYATVLDAASSAVAGVFGVFSCVSCTWPILGTITTTAAGSASALILFGQDLTPLVSWLAQVGTQNAYLLSTLVFLSSVALLKWRPGFLGETGTARPER